MNIADYLTVENITLVVGFVILVTQSNKGNLLVSLLEALGLKPKSPAPVVVDPANPPAPPVIVAPPVVVSPVERPILDALIKLLPVLVPLLLKQQAEEESRGNSPTVKGFAE